MKSQRSSEVERAKLERSKHDFERFLHLVSHDLKAPLRAIQHTALWIEQDLPGELLGTEIGDNLKLLRGRADRMQALIDALLEYSRAGETGALEQGVSSYELATEIVRRLAPPATIEVYVDETLPHLHTVREPLAQVLSNLIANAIEYRHKEDLTVWVSATEAGGKWTFLIRDDGPGIDARDHDRVFEVFQTLRPDDGQGGTGMGLALVKRIVESYGGEVWLDSALGQGSSFFFSWSSRQGEDTDAAC